jgi:kynureninase
MTAIQDMVDLIGTAGIQNVRAKSVALTEFAVEVAEGLLAGYGVVISSPRDASQRGSHVTIDHPSFKKAVGRLWDQGIIPDFREPDGLRLGLSPLSTSFEEVYVGVAAIEAELALG